MDDPVDVDRVSFLREDRSRRQCQQYDEAELPQMIVPVSY